MLVLLPALFYLFIIIGLIHLVHFAMYLVGANIYDIKYFRNISRTGRQEPYKPLVSVLIPAYNEEAVIERCLQSVWNNIYDNIEIIVINDGSEDGTVYAAQRFITSRTRVYRQTTSKVVRTKNGLRRVWRRGQTPISRRIKLVSQRNDGKASALNNGLRYHARGELIMSLDADSLIHKRAIANAVQYFKNPKVVGVAANVRIIEEHSILGLLQRFEHLIGYRSKKFYSLINCELLIGGVASTYRLSALKKVRFYDNDTVTEDIGLSMKIAARGNRKNQLVYAADVAAVTEGVQDFMGLLNQRYRWKLGNLQNLFKYRKMFFSNNKKYTKSLTWYRVPMSFVGEALLLLEPIALGYVIYLSVKFATPALFMSAYLAITAYILLTILPDEHLTVWGKVKASLYAPLLYFILYIMNLVQLISALRCLMNHKQVVNLKTTKITWISPRRSGKAASFS